MIMKDISEKSRFRKEMSCVDQIFVWRQVSEKIIEKRWWLSSPAACMNLEKAYDNMD